MKHGKKRRRSSNAKLMMRKIDYGNKIMRIAAMNRELRRKGVLANESGKIES